MGGCVIVVFSHGTPSLMPLEVEQLSIVMCDIEVFCGPPPSNMDFDFDPSRILVELRLEKLMVFHPPPSCA
jgi:hypothetical protein